MDRISVSQYLNDENLIEIIDYIPFEGKVTLVDAILQQVEINTNGMYSLDSVILYRIKTQIYIEQYSNLDLNIRDENNISGYDLLIKNNKLNDVIDLFKNEYEELEKIMKLRLEDYCKYKASTLGFLNYKIEKLISNIKNISMDITDTLVNIDEEKVVKIIGTILDKMSDVKKNVFNKKK